MGKRGYKKRYAKMLQQRHFLQEIRSLIDTALEKTLREVFDQLPELDRENIAWTARVWASKSSL